jgi:hypothetical protein
MKYIGILLGLVLVAGGGYYLYTNSMAPQESPEPQETVVEESPSADGSTTFGELIARSGSWECNVSMNAGDVASEGKVYIANGNIRGDFESMVSGQVFGSHMIQTGGYVYSWTDMTPQGFRSPVATSGQGDAAASSQGFDASAGVQYDCSSWAGDSSRFALPEGITFAEAPAAQ